MSSLILLFTLLVPGCWCGICATGGIAYWLTVGERRFAITLTDNVAARAFAAQLPLTLDMSELNGNEKHTELPKALPAKELTGNDPQWRSHVVRLNDLGGLLSDIRFVVLSDA